MAMAETSLAYVGKALGIISQDWSELGFGDDPAVAASSDLSECTERITAMLLVRVIAWVQPQGTFSDLSTTTVCRDTLTNADKWPATVTPEIVEQLKHYVHTILSGYNDVPYHNFEHCYHVTLSTNKLIDMIVNVPPGEPRPCSYGFRDDPLMQFAQVFSALIHDVEHRGIPNRQLALEDDALAIQYNDQSIAEMRSLYIGFSELLKSDYDALRSVIFPVKKDYLRFREGTVNLVLTTDLASPERSQIGKSKWKEAFGDDYETVERKLLKEMERRQPMKSRRTSMTQGSRRMSVHSIMSELSLESPMVGPDGALSDDDSVSVSDDDLDTDDVAAKANGTPIFRAPVKEGEKLTPAPKRKKSVDLSTDGSAIANAGAQNLSGMALKFHRRLSSIGANSSNAVTNSTPGKKGRNTRLGIMRTVDLSGEALETYGRHNIRPSATGANTDSASVGPAVLEEIDPLRETVLMEVIMKAADVAHNLQSYEHMEKWSNRLFLELKRAYVQGRGTDPQDGWFNNQIGFLEMYLLPLARKLDDTGAFGDQRGAIFEKNVEISKDRWMKEGASCTANIIREGHEKFPEEDSDEEN